MSLILGTEYCKIDSNGRFKFPNALKKQLGGDEVRFVIRNSIFFECLELWTYDNFYAELQKLQSRLSLYKREDLELLREFSEGNIIELDSNDRLIIPQEQKERLHNAKDIVLQSLGTHIEVWDRSTYQNRNDKSKNFASIAEKRLGDMPAAELNKGSKQE